MRTRLSALAREEDGQVLVLVAIAMFALVAVAGLVADGGTLMVQRRDLQAVADAAAAAGAMAVDEGVYRASGGTTVVLDPGAAEAAAIAVLMDEDGTDYAVRADGERVEVEVSRQATTVFLGAVGVTHVAIEARAVAAPRFGVGGP